MGANVPMDRGAVREDLYILSGRDRDFWLTKHAVEGAIKFEPAAGFTHDECIRTLVFYTNFTPAHVRKLLEQLTAAEAELAKLKPPKEG